MALPMHEAQLGIEMDQRALHREVATTFGVELTELAGWHINRIRPDGAIDAEVPLASIDVDAVPTDPENIERLIGLFDEYAEEAGGTGQRDAVVIAHVPGEGFFMVDGFHRHGVQTQRGEPRLNGVVEPNRTYEQVVKRQLEYARKHPEVEFARQVEWMQSVWDRSELSEQIPNVLTAFRAFQDTYADNKTDDVELIDALSDADYEAVREWVKEKSQEWGYTPKQIREKLARAESFDPELMQLVYQKKGNPPEGRIGLGHVEAVTEIYGYEFEIQKEVVQLVVEHQLTVAQTQLLIGKIENHSPATAAQVRKIAKSIDIRAIRAESRIRGTGGKPVNASLAQARKASDQDLLGVVRERLDSMSTAALENHDWSVRDAKLAKDVAIGLGLMVVGLSEGGAFTQRELRDAKTTFERYARRLGRLCTEESPEDKNLKRHEAWGLTFKLYDDDVAPTVVLDGKAQFDLDDTASTVLYRVAQEPPGVDHPATAIKRWLDELGFSKEDEKLASEADIRIAITQIDKKLGSLSKQGHLIIRTGGQRQIRFGLVG